MSHPRQKSPQARRALIPAVAAMLAVAGVLAGPAGAAPANQTPPAQTAPAQEAKPDAAAAVKVTGFRSAQFGMTVDEVTKAIGKDFRISGNDIRREQNPTERTTSLIVRVDDLQNGAGPAAVAYIFGHSSQRLFQVNILWGGAVNPKADPNTLVGSANAMRNYFVQQGYQSAGMLLNAPIGDGSQVVVFRGTDAQGRMTLLTLAVPKPAEGAKPADGKAPAPQEAPVMQLSYIEKPNEPDVFRIEKGF